MGIRPKFDGVIPSQMEWSFLIQFDIEVSLCIATSDSQPK